MFLATCLIYFGDCSCTYEYKEKQHDDVSYNRRQQFKKQQPRIRYLQNVAKANTKGVHTTVYVMSLPKLNTVPYVFYGVGQNTNSHNLIPTARTPTSYKTDRKKTFKEKNSDCSNLHRSNLEFTVIQQKGFDVSDRKSLQLIMLEVCTVAN